MFDLYSLKARFYPVIILFFPIIVIGVAYSLEFEKIIGLFSSIGVAGALTYLFSQLGRDRGKKKEKELWSSWGGAPSTQLLRLRDTRIDKHTTDRYHQRLHTLCPVPVIPNLDLENTACDECDQVYSSWTKFLITKTRDTKTYSLLFKDNISYGFRRNLWGLKLYGILLTTSLILGNYFFWVFSNGSWNPLLFSNSFKYSTVVLFLVVLFWIFIVNKEWVKVPAFSYAERLCETIDQLP
ncbi:hypothetical protein QNI16_36025 [Cytophagaceae bacterium YF14B1]|uniref:Uncharacterized protein n=1 Tax=Xanthocytophaga flava TaxID=3048013 RepID=A0AAE3QYM9_9BACT|nr:hypothetical protein [Xanthocytophaga flavus]MDJ1485945.1 hypothetical protein [Xanthocytophaga flavus]